jgi:hypothetical protein
LKVFDLSGKLVTTLADAAFETGEHMIELNAAKVQAGIYILRLRTTGLVQTRRLVVVK